MSVNRDAASVVDIYLACEDILTFTQGLTWHDFALDVKTQSAVAYKLTIIGEAVGRISPEFKTQNASIPWRRIADTRNVLTHQYDRVKLETVWGIVSERVPELLESIRPLLPNEHE